MYPRQSWSELTAPVEMRQLQVGASCIKTLLWDLAVINKRFESLQALQELVYIVHQLQAATQSTNAIFLSALRVDRPLAGFRHDS